MPTLDEVKACLAANQPDAAENMARTFIGGLSANDLFSHAIALDLLAKAQLAQGKTSEGFQSLDKARELVESHIKSPEENGQETKRLVRILIGLYQNISYALMENRDYAEAERAALKALELAEKLGEEPVIASVSFGLSAVAYRQKKFKMAEELVLAARSQWEKLGNLEKVGTCLNNLGRLYEEMGDVDTGISYHKKAVHLRRSLPNRLDLAFSLGNLGVALATAGDWEPARASLAEAVAIYQEQGGGDSSECKGFSANLALCNRVLNEGGKETSL